MLKKANDLDRGMEGEVMYSVAETVPVDAPISISPLSRSIIFTDVVDREKTEQFVVKVSHLSLHRCSILLPLFSPMHTKTLISP